MQGDVAHNMYPVPAVYQTIFNQLIKFCLTVIFSEQFGENHVILLQMAVK